MKETKKKKRQKIAIKPNQNILNSGTFLSNIQVYVWKALFLQDYYQGRENIWDGNRNIVPQVSVYPA